MPFQAKQCYEKIGEATETALTVLCEKLNYYNTDKSGMDMRGKGVAANQAIQEMWKKEFTLEFSRDRKSMSVYCVPNKPTRVPGSARMFAKVITSTFSTYATAKCIYLIDANFNLYL